MANKRKKIIKNNLLKIREELGYSQADFGKLLDVSERMICNYETGECNLPVDKAMLLSEKYNYSLDWIYCNEDSINHNSSIHLDSSQSSKFTVDIRDFVSCSNEMLNITIPDNYWKYVNELNSIILSNKTDNEKKRLKAELDGNYKSKDRSKKVWRISIPQQEVLSYIYFDCNYIPFTDNQNDKDLSPTKVQLEEVNAFLNSLQ